MTLTPSFEAFAASLVGLLELDRDAGCIEPETRLVEDLGFDSILLSEIYIVLADLAGRPLPAEFASGTLTVGDVYAYVCRFTDVGPAG